MIEEDDYPSLASIIALEEMVSRKAQDAVISVCDAQDVDFKSRDESVVAYETAKVADAALKPCSTQEELEFDMMLLTQDQVDNILKSVSNTLDPVALQMSIGSMMAESLDVEDDLGR